MLSSLTNQMQTLNEQAHSFAFDIIFHSLKSKLHHVPTLEVMHLIAHSPPHYGIPVKQVCDLTPESLRSLGGDLPEFSLSPLPYITEVPP